MGKFNKKFLASLVVIAVIVSLLTGILLAGTAAAQLTTCPLDEDFSTWLPSGWTTDDWGGEGSNIAGGTPPEARLIWALIVDDYAYLDSKPVDTTDLSDLTLEFKSFIYDFDGSQQAFNCMVYTRADGGDSWADVTPWSNPINADVGPATYSVDISSDIGSSTQVRFEFGGPDNSDIDNWWVDDVKICGDIDIAPPPPPPVGAVGGEAYPINKTGLLTPWLALAVVIAAGGVYLVRRRAHS